MKYDRDEVTYTCPQESAVLDVLLDYEAISAICSPATIAGSADPSLWRYQPLLPVAAPASRTGPLGAVGGTPLYAARRAAKRLGLEQLWIKDDGRLPTGSLKDRASAIVASRALEMGGPPIITASTGNAGVAQAAMATDAGLRAIVAVPATAPEAKIAQLLMFGADLLLVQGNYDAAFGLVQKASHELGYYCRNTGYNPLTAEGKKTVAYEICEQLTQYDHRLSEAPANRWSSPDRIFVSVGDGNIISGVHKGLRDMQQLGWIDSIPKLIGVQSTGSAAVARAFSQGVDTIEPVVANTIADSIAADSPSDGWRALRAARQTDGAIISVTDDEILAAMLALGQDATVFAEPAAAAAYAGLLQQIRRNELDPTERIVVLITGNGLKDVTAATRAVPIPEPIEPTVPALRGALEIVSTDASRSLPR